MKPEPETERSPIPMMETNNPDNAPAPQPRLRRAQVGPFLLVNLILALLFLAPTLDYLIHWPFLKTTVQASDLAERVAEHLAYPISLVFGMLGTLFSVPNSRLCRLFLSLFTLCCAATGLLAPIYILGAGVLAVGGAFLSAFKDRQVRFILTFILMIVSGIGFMVPFTDEAAKRSRVARIRGDQRTVTIALETYNLDHNAYPTHTFVPAEKACWHSTSPLPTFRLHPATGAVPLTTPVAYLTALFTDPFRFLDEDRTFAYYSDGPTYIIVSPGPDCVFDLTSQTLALYVRQATGRAPGDPYTTLVPFTYDPSNGSRSAGDVYRIKQ